LVNSDTGNFLIKEIRNSVFLEERTIEEAKKVNHQLYTPSVKPKQRDKIFSYIYENSYDSVNNRYINTPYKRVRHLVGNILRFLKLK